MDVFADESGQFREVLLKFLTRILNRLPEEVHNLLKSYLKEEVDSIDDS